MTLLEEVRFAIAQATFPGKNVIDQGPFRLFLDEKRDVVYVNYAVPVAKVLNPSEEIQRLIETFQFNKRTPRLEFALELSPELPAALEAAGFRQGQGLPMMACRREHFHARPSSACHIHILGPDDDVRMYYWTANQAFDMQMPVSDQPRPKARADAETGFLDVAIATDDQGKPVGCAVLGPTSELSGVGVLPDYRGRGIGSAVSSALLERHFKAHDLAWLAADTEAAASMYRGLGFEEVGTHVAYVKS